MPIPTSAEAFQWVGDLLPEEREGRFFIRGRAIHPCKTYHPHEWPQIRVYLEEELIKSAPSLTDKPLLIDHTTELEPPNKVFSSRLGKTGQSNTSPKSINRSTNSSRAARSSTSASNTTGMS